MKDSVEIKKNNKNKLGMYIHIPFCVSKCNYCAFLSFSGLNEELQQKYIKALIREIEFYGRQTEMETIDSIFIGGGTPSILKANLMAELMESINKCFKLENNCEITIESNPKTLDMKKLSTYLSCGVNRLSMGVQSLDDKMLRRLGRAHDRQDFLDNYQLARKVGFENINTDLMFAIPDHTMDMWQRTLQEILALLPEHISFYSLQLEDGTPFFQMFINGEIDQIPDELDRRMYYTAIEKLENKGYHHYEISNAARKGFECRHNLKYWSMKEYLGLGLGAHSYFKGVRFNNTENMGKYLDVFGEENLYYDKEQNRKTGFDMAKSIECYNINTLRDEISEYIFTGMRKTNGINLLEFEKRFGGSFRALCERELEVDWKKIEGYIKEGYILVNKVNRGNVKFSLKGIDISNTILSEFA